jgi:membrane fusion protein (multidrug efflux system)
VNSQTGAIRIAAAFPNPQNLLRPGQFGRVKANTELRHQAIVVPQAAVAEFQGQQQVYTVTADNKVHVNNVTLGPQSGTSWVIEEGLPSGATVIVDNLQKLREGAPVSPQVVKAQSVSPSQGPRAAGR